MPPPTSTDAPLAGLRLDPGLGQGTRHAGLEDEPSAVASPRTYRTWSAVLADLFKARLNSLVLLTAAAGFDLGSGSQMRFGRQVPHFMAIAWIYRDEYALAGFRMLPGVDPLGRRTAHQALLFTVGLLPLSLFPYFLDLAGRVYLLSSVALSLAFI